MGHFNNIATVQAEYRFFPSFFILGVNKVVFVQGCSQGCYKVVYKVATRLSQGCLQGCYKVVTRLLQGCSRVNCIPVTRL